MKTITVKNIADNITGITLLSIDEYKKAKAPIPHTLPEDWVQWWWLRSSDRSDDTKAYICCDDVSFYQNDSSFRTSRAAVSDIKTFDVKETAGVRPALKLNASFVKNLEWGYFWFAGHRWTVISDKLALCNDILYEMAFRKDRWAKNANKYAYSDISKFLRTWLATAREFEARPLDAALIRKPHNTGLSREEIELLLDKFPKESMLFNIVLPGKTGQASGFSTFDPKETGTTYFASVMDKESQRSPDGVYEHNDIKIYIQ